jgi:hypothetical protein
VFEERICYPETNSLDSFTMCFVARMTEANCPQGDAPSTSLTIKSTETGITPLTFFLHRPQFLDSSMIQLNDVYPLVRDLHSRLRLSKDDPISLLPNIYRTTRIVSNRL